MDYVFLSQDPLSCTYYNPICNFSHSREKTFTVFHIYTVLVCAQLQGAGTITVV